ncbi:DUF2190 family protein [Cereibacter azotoformans]|uniref:Putative RecA/RadA family phage recombinase n=1 Tax=Cereibacter azotoformans TaxID=43057 RepID=A0A2T5JPV5_9RHOB|nr:DUF2190 family protein [Cereibacter azotoformans]AXQ95684.1 DUF2190 family protein [Cereibacter sphaeroides]PTR09684.1 putative RecA/RadA family phage recombinase [Cereibacter azotoformans]UIJ32820.1 DUF2190 family protein [Cereibacter azotoformans]
MKNFVQPGDTLTIPAPASVLSGQPVIAGEIVGIASGDAASGAAVDVATSGVFELPKVAADAVTLGAPIYWDAEAELATTTETDNIKLGVAVAAAAASTATVRVRLSGF